MASRMFCWVIRRAAPAASTTRATTRRSAPTSRCAPHGGSSSGADIPRPQSDAPSAVRSPETSITTAPSRCRARTESASWSPPGSIASAKPYRCSSPPATTSCRPAWRATAGRRVDARRGLRFDPQQRGEPAAVGQAEQLPAGRTQPLAVRDVARVAGVQVGPGVPSRQPSIAFAVRRIGRVEQRERLLRHLVDVDPGGRCQIREHAPVRAEHRGVQHQRVDPVQLPQHAAVHRDHPAAGEDPAELRGVPLASAAGGLGQRGQAQRGGSLGPGERRRRRRGGRTGGQHRD